MHISNIHRYYINNFFMDFCIHLRHNQLYLHEYLPRQTFWHNFVSMWHQQTMKKYSIQDSCTVTFTHFADAFIQSDLQCIQAISYFHYVCSLGVEPITFCAANAMLYHWATGTVTEWQWQMAFCAHRKSVRAEWTEQSRTVLCLCWQCIHPFQEL